MSVHNISIPLFGFRRNLKSFLEKIISLYCSEGKCEIQRRLDFISTFFRNFKETSDYYTAI